MARPTKQTGEVREKLIECLKEGMSREATANYCGISRETLNVWMREAEGEFADALIRAEAEAEKSLVGRISQASRTPSKEANCWQAAAWILERRFRGRWSRQDKVEHSGAVGAVSLDEETYKRLLRAALKESGEE